MIDAIVSDFNFSETPDVTQIIRLESSHFDSLKSSELAENVVENLGSRSIKSTKIFPISSVLFEIRL